VAQAREMIEVWQLAIFAGWPSTSCLLTQNRMSIWVGELIFNTSALVCDTESIAIRSYPSREKLLEERIQIKREQKIGYAYINGLPMRLLRRSQVWKWHGRRFRSSLPTFLR
jgi:hypothetical protein